MPLSLSVTDAVPLGRALVPAVLGRKVTDVLTLDSDEVRAVLAGERGVVVNVETAAAILGVGRSTLYARPLPGTITVGRAQRVPVPVLRRALGLDPDAYTVPGYARQVRQ